MARNLYGDNGSRKHVLDLVESAQFHETLNSILLPTGFGLDHPALNQPSGRTDNHTYREYELEKYLADPSRRMGKLPVIADDWWFAHKTGNNRRPIWDLIARLKKKGNSTVRGLLLVEAKAHENELKIKDSKEPPADTSEQSIKNDQQIRRRIKQSNTMLNRHRCGRFKLTVDSHYQLSNRMAYAAQLSALGYRVVLLYLGFTGDTYFKNSIRDNLHWQRSMGGYFQGVVPQAFPEQNHRLTNNGSLYLRIATLPARRKSTGKRLDN